MFIDQNVLGTLHTKHNKILTESFHDDEDVQQCRVYPRAPLGSGARSPQHGVTRNHTRRACANPGSQAPRHTLTWRRNFVTTKPQFTSHSKLAVVSFSHHYKAIRCGMNKVKAVVSLSFFTSLWSNLKRYPLEKQLLLFRNGNPIWPCASKSFSPGTS